MTFCTKIKYIFSRLFVIARFQTHETNNTSRWRRKFGLLYIGVTISILIGYKHAANSCWLCFRYVIPTDNSFYTCRSDVIPTDNSFMHAEVTSPNTLNSSLSNFVMAESTSRFATLSAENLDLHLDDKDVN